MRDEHRHRAVEPLVDQVVSRWPYSLALRGFWITDDGSLRSEALVWRMTQTHPRLVSVHYPVRASWLNQIDTYFSIVQRKELTHNDFLNLQAVADRLADFDLLYKSIAHPFEWKFTRTGLDAFMASMRSPCAETSTKNWLPEQ